MKRKSRKQELAEFFEACSLFMPPNKDAQEGIRFHILYGNKYNLGGATPEERLASLKEVNEAFKGKRVVHERACEGTPVLLVSHVLPKTETEIVLQLRARAGDKKGLLETKPINPYKVCVTDVLGNGGRIVPLDMLVHADEKSAERRALD